MTRNYKKLPRVALAGRRNVGKSTLLNTLYGRRRAITDEIAGLTRDIIEVEINKAPYSFLLSDTPGLDIDNPGKLESIIVDRAFEYIKSVDLILFLLEAPSPGVFDYEFIELFRKKNIETPVLYVVNKIDGAEQVLDGMAEFYSMGLDPLIPISAKGRWNLQELLQTIASLCPGVEDPGYTFEEKIIKKYRPASKKSLRKNIQLIDDPVEPHVEEDHGEGAVALEIDFADESNFEEAISSFHTVKADKDELKIPDTIDESAPEQKRDDVPTEKSDAINSTATQVQSVASEYVENKERNIEHSSSVISDSRASQTRIALIGRPNAGKSSIFNRLTNRDLAIVSDVPGTTRDTMDTVFAYQGSSIRIMDTAGLRRVGKYRGKDSVEFYSASRTRRAIRDARVVVHIIDTVVGITDYDKKISAQIRELHRPVIIAFNKWDAVEDKNHNSIRDFMDKFRFFFPQIQQIPTVFCSALTGKRISQLIDLSLDLDRKMKTRIPTGALNQKVKSWLKQGPTSSRSLRVYYVSQVETEPPAFVFFVNRKSFFRENLRLYLENKLRKDYNLEGIPMDLLIRERKKEEKESL